MTLKLSLRILAPLVVVVALTACSPFAPRNPRVQLPHDPRFTKFTSKTEGNPKLGDQLDSFNERMPALGATEGHFAAGLIPTGWSLLPTPDRQHWYTGVATVPDETIKRLQAGASGDAKTLPGIYPELYQYVPQDCHFSTIPSDHANKVLETNKTSMNSKYGSLTIKEFAASMDCHLVLVVGEIRRG